MIFVSHAAFSALVRFSDLLGGGGRAVYGVDFLLRNNPYTPSNFDTPSINRPHLNYYWVPLQKPAQLQAPKKWMKELAVFLYQNSSALYNGWTWKVIPGVKYCLIERVKFSIFKGEQRFREYRRILISI